MLYRFLAGMLILFCASPSNATVIRMEGDGHLNVHLGDLSPGIFPLHSPEYDANVNYDDPDAAFVAYATFNGSDELTALKISLFGITGTYPTLLLGSSINLESGFCCSPVGPTTGPGGTIEYTAGYGPTSASLIFPPGPALPGLTLSGILNGSSSNGISFQGQAFSTAEVPEPSNILLLSAGILFLLILKNYRLFSFAQLRIKQE